MYLMLVHEVMTRQVYTVHEDAPFNEIVDILVQNKISGAPVLDSRKRIVGVISEKDLLIRLFPTLENFYQNLLYYLDHNRIEMEAVEVVQLRAKDLMSRKIITVGPKEHILKACALLLVHNIRRLPVVENEELVGIVSTEDLYKNYLHSFIKG